MAEIDKQEIAENIVKKILPKYFKFTIDYIEVQQDGSSQTINSKLTEKLINEIENTLK